MMAAREIYPMFERIMNQRSLPFAPWAVFACLILTTCAVAQETKSTPIKPSSMARTGSVDERFQSYNIEMVEVTGGRFWRPYDAQVDAILAGQAAKDKGANQPAGMSPDLYQYRPPIDLSNGRLRELAAALGPAYLRVSGTWQNTTYFQDTDDPAPEKAPQGFNGVLTRKQWKSVIDFSHVANAKIISSFATSMGTRDAAGVWTTDQASRWLAYTKSIGGNITAAEYMNEPTFAAFAGVPKGYDAAAFARDVAVFVPFIRKTAPDMVILGPGSVGEGFALAPGSIQMLKTEDMLKDTGPVFDAFSYHFYGTISRRCAAAMGGNAGTTPEAALTDEWLSRTNTVEAFYGGLRDKFLPGKPVWLTETGQAACGGDRWAASFIDSFRYLNQLGTLAQRGVQVVAHNTLAASDYGLLDEKNFAPRPNYWAALLWRRMMGATVLNPGETPNGKVKIYAHCLRNAPGGVALLVMNTDRTAALSLATDGAGERYTLTAPDLLQSRVDLNGTELKLGADDSLPKLSGTATKPGELSFAPASITFLAMPKANNAACR
jgi:heparanase 1